MNVEELKYKDLTYKIIGCAMEVHRTLGTGYPEYIYQNALAIELKRCDIPFEKEFEMRVLYKGEYIGLRRVDFLVAKTISVELKARTTLDDVHLAQALNYLESSHLEVGLLINFGASSLQYKRLLNRKFAQHEQSPATVKTQDQEVYREQKR